MAKIKLEYLAEKGNHGPRELEDGRGPGRLQQPVDLPESAGRAVQISQAKGDCYRVELVVAKGSRERVALGDEDWELGAQRLVSANNQHGMAKIHRPDCRRTGHLYR